MRLSQSPDGRRLVYSFERAWKDGSYAVLPDPLDLIARLAALIPPPNFHMVRYHSVLAAWCVDGLGRGAGDDLAAGLGVGSERAELARWMKVGLWDQS